jgi:hypothetical protein
MSESGSRDAAAGLAEHSKDAASGPNSTSQSQNRDPLAAAGDSTQELLRALLAWVHDRPLTALIVAGTAGWMIGRVGKYI